VTEKTSTAARRIARNWLPRKLRERNESSLTRAISRLMEIHFRAAINYSPEPYPGKVTLFCCSDRATRSYEDRLAWCKVDGAGLEVHVVPGNDLSMMEDPHVQVMAGKLRDCLERALQALNSPAMLHL
jgi:aspartate racemase